MKFGLKLLSGLAFLWLAGCTTTTTPQSKQSASLPTPDYAPFCENAVAKIYIGYPTARLNQCDASDTSQFNFTIHPEKTTDPQGQTINNSPWYGFRVDPLASGTIKFTLNYENGTHRYQPKISYDGVNWTALADAQTPNKRPISFSFSMQTDGRPFFVSAQEAFSKSAHDKWTQTTAKLPFVTQSFIGKSRDGHPIHMLEAKTEPDVQKPYVMWVGRQHPPEVTGALALIPFTETVFGDSALAKRFRKHFNILVVPMMNPDGVTDGHWRFNKGGMDLNRDWGPFSQPETQAIKSSLKRFETGQERIAFFLDFHSTWRNLLYTQTDEEPTSPPMFARDWLDAVDKKLDDEVYAFTREPRPKSDRAISKNYMYETYGISAITYEVGDATNRDAIKTSAEVFAQEMMTLLLKHETGQ